MGQSIDLVRLIRQLEQAEGHCLDRNTLCSQLSITQDELLDTVEDALVYGVQIEEVSDAFLLEQPVDLLDQDVIYKGVTGAGRVEVLSQIDSTNSYMLRNAALLASGDTVLAEIQTAGRGRRGNRWHTAFGRQLMLSTCIVFDSLDTITGLSLGIGVAVAQSVEHFSRKEIKLKWPNDIYYNEKKIGGILIETVPYNGKVKAVIGVGVNVYEDDLGDIGKNYTSVYDSKEKIPDSFSRNELAIQLINRIKKICRMYVQSQRAAVIEAFEARDYLLGRMVCVEHENGVCQGRAAGIDENGSLKIVSSRGESLISSGHITFI
ncbi:MAG: biotin--[acetyl-CoA-carboxylase] ligase [Succinivibrio sp.]